MRFLAPFLHLILKMQYMIVINARFLTQKITGVQRVAFEICNRMQSQISNKKIVFVAPNDNIVNHLNNNINNGFPFSFKKRGKSICSHSWPLNFPVKTILILLFK